jgi:hypothetical protein|uniref:Uncharacterized protein n=1 Tax=Rhodopseudomonas palustris (strain BisA53) TaxID=316055 RepID=Q07IL3_RHOP5
MAQTRAFATYTDVDGTTKRYIDMSEQMTNQVDLIGHTIIGLISGTSWPIRERAFMAALTTMNRYEIERVARFVNELQGSFVYYNEIEALQNRRRDS